MRIQKWDRRDMIFDGLLDPAYRDLESCDVYYVADKGYAVLNRKPQYGLYDRLDIPEIQDIFVGAAFRRQGIATALIGHCENLALAAEKPMIGISVPVSPQFGPAQRLYASLGYRPDGNGVTYDRQPVIHNAAYRVDDSLCLMLMKDLS